MEPSWWPCLMHGAVHLIGVGFIVDIVLTLQLLDFGCLLCLLLICTDWPAGVRLISNQSNVVKMMSFRVDYWMNWSLIKAKDLIEQQLGDIFSCEDEIDSERETKLEIANKVNQHHRRRSSFIFASEVGGWWRGGRRSAFVSHWNATSMMEVWVRIKPNRFKCTQLNYAAAFKVPVSNQPKVNCNLIKPEISSVDCITVDFDRSISGS